MAMGAAGSTFPANPRQQEEPMASWSERIALEILADRRFRVIGARTQPPDMEGAVELYVECYGYECGRALKVARGFARECHGTARVVDRLEKVATVGLLITSSPGASDEQTLVESAQRLFLQLLADSRGARDRS